MWVLLLFGDVWIVPLGPRGNLPLSTITPPIDVPMSADELGGRVHHDIAPCSNRPHRYGDANVLSITTSGHVGLMRDLGHCFDITSSYADC